MATHFDALVIGTGQAGPALAARLDKEGMKVAVVEKARFGGTCVNDGCTPTKALVASAYAAHLARRSGDYGIHSGKVTVNMKRVKARKDEIVAKSNKGVRDWMHGLKNGKVFHGHARFTGASTVQVGSHELEADRIYINVGGRPLIPKMPGFDQVEHLTNTSM